MELFSIRIQRTFQLVSTSKEIQRTYLQTNQYNRSMIIVFSLSLLNTSAR